MSINSTPTTPSADRRELLPIAGLLGTVVFAGYMVTQLHAQAAVAAGDFTNSSTAEVHDAQGQILSRGQFSATDDDGDDVERKAPLQPAGSDPDVAGEAEIEFAKNGATRQEIEFEVRNLAPGTAVTFVIDGQAVGQAVVDNRGRAALEVNIDLPAVAAAR